MNPSRVVVGASSEKQKILWLKSTSLLPIQGFLLFLWMKNHLNLQNMLPTHFSSKNYFYE
jgi:hypothetical protein